MLCSCRCKAFTWMKTAVVSYRLHDYLALVCSNTASLRKLAVVVLSHIISGMTSRKLFLFTSYIPKGSTLSRCSAIILIQIRSVEEFAFCYHFCRYIFQRKQHLFLMSILFILFKIQAILHAVHFWENPQINSDWVTVRIIANSLEIVRVRNSEGIAKDKKFWRDRKG